MIQEVVDKNSGAILFKKDEESKNIDLLLKKVKTLETKVSSLEKRLKAIEDTE